MSTSVRELYNLRACKTDDVARCVPAQIVTAVLSETWRSSATCTWYCSSPLPLLHVLVLCLHVGVKITRKGEAVRASACSEAILAQHMRRSRCAHTPDESYSRQSPDHRRTVARWLACLGLRAPSILADGVDSSSSGKSGSEGRASQWDADRQETETGFLRAIGNGTRLEIVRYSKLASWYTREPPLSMSEARRCKTHKHVMIAHPMRTMHLASRRAMCGCVHVPGTHVQHCIIDLARMCSIVLLT
jgi:hypothetical protein